jgi:hypothetical protein
MNIWNGMETEKMLGCGLTRLALAGMAFGSTPARTAKAAAVPRYEWPNEPWGRAVDTVPQGTVAQCSNLRLAPWLSQSS